MDTPVRIVLGTSAVLFALLAQAFGQQPVTPAPQKIEIPESATLEGLPTVRVESTADATKRQVLSVTEAASNRLRLRVREGRFYLADHEDRPLTRTSSGPFTYLASEPGRYIRLTQLNGRIYYVEHTDAREYGSGSVTWWGEIRIVLDRQ